MGLLSNEHGALFLIFNLFDVLSETIAVLNLIYVYFASRSQGLAHI